MENILDAVNAYLAERTTQDMSLEQQLMMAFAAGAIFGANQVEAAVEAKYIIMKTNKQDKS